MLPVCVISDINKSYPLRNPIAELFNLVVKTFYIFKITIENLKVREELFLGKNASKLLNCSLKYNEIKYILP